MGQPHEHHRPPDAARRPADSDWLSTRTAITVALVALAPTAVAALVFDEGIVLEAGALLVAMIYGVYLGFAITAGTPREIAIESAFLAVGLATAFLALRYGTEWLAIGLILHGVWDLLHHPRHRIVGTSGVPGWYVPFCAVYDFTAAIAVMLLA